MLFEKTGLTIHDEARATPGYTLFSPLGSYKTHLINMRGDVVHQWDLPGAPGNYAYLLPNGNLLLSVRTEDGPQAVAAKGGHMMEMDWDGNVVWEHVDHYQHHDFRRAANGNTYYLAWELLPEQDHHRVKGGLPETEHADGIYCDIVREITPAGETAWEWRAAIDQEIERYPLNPLVHRNEFAHANTVCPLPNGDVIVNWRLNGLMAIIDRETRKFKWELMEPAFGQQHDVQMLEGGNLLFFANGTVGMDEGPLCGSRVIELDPATNEIQWEYMGSPRTTFFSWFISGVQRLPSGNTLICEGVCGRLFEVTPAGDIVWNYVSPFIADEFPYEGGKFIFRVYRYAASSPEIAGRLPADPS